MSQSIRKFKCSPCSYGFESPYGILKPQVCPKCSAQAQFIHCADTGPRRQAIVKKK